MRFFKKLLTILVILIFVEGAVYKVYLVPRCVVPILMYHSVDSGSGNTLKVTPKNFEKQIAFLSKQKYDVISLNDLVDGIKQNRKFSSKTVVITFDDGFKDNYINAFPVLARHKMPAAIFLITSYIGNNKDYLTWDQVRLMMDNGIDFGGHTKNDIYLPGAHSEAVIVDEITGSKRDIEQNTNKEVNFFCYPIGGFNDKIKDIVKVSGYKAACTTNRGRDRYNRDVYELNRVKITNSDMTKPFHFRAKLSGYYNLFRSLKSPE